MNAPLLSIPSSPAPPPSHPPQLLVTVLTRGEVTEMMTLAVTAAQCMNKVAISREIREFTHKGKADGRLKEKVN